MPDDLLGKGPGKRERVVAEELDDPGDAMNPWLCCTYFPVMDGRFIHLELLRDLSLEEPQAHPALADMVTYCGKRLWIPKGWGFGGASAQVTKEQRTPAPADT